MPRFSKISKERLETCHPDIQAVCNELIKQYDFSVLCGHRGEKEQNQAYKKGTSQVKYPNSAHNKKPSLAVDLAPYPIDWDNLSRFREMIIRFDTVANMLRAEGKIESDFVYGGYWNSIKDWPHIEIKEK
ncbi:MAG: M15 family metallopeptidase [Alphaproteobacteria bacterium]|nr:M15 family metallopeptidase [Alphaproteobacteria bacterium]